MKYRKITELTDDEIKFIVNEIYKPEKITRIIRLKREDIVRVRVKTRWHTTDDDGKDIYYLDSEELTFRDPFRYRNAFESDSNAYGFCYCDNYEKYKKYCLAKGVCYLLKDNPYLEVNNGQ